MLNLRAVTGSTHEIESYVAPITISILDFLVIYIFMIAPEVVPNWVVAVVVLGASTSGAFVWLRRWAKKLDKRFARMNERLDEQAEDALIDRAMPHLRIVETGKMHSLRPAAEVRPDGR